MHSRHLPANQQSVDKQDHLEDNGARMDEHRRAGDACRRRSRLKNVNKLDEMSTQTILLLLLFLQLAASSMVQVRCHQANVPFKTSFVSASDYLVRRNGALLSALPMANAEAQHPAEALIIAGQPADSVGLDERDYGDQQRTGEYARSPVEAAQAADAYSGRPAQSETSGAQYAMQDDLLAAPSAEQANQTEPTNQADNRTAPSDQTATTTTTQSSPTSTTTITTTTTGSSSSTPPVTTTSTTAAPTTPVKEESKPENTTEIARPQETPSTGMSLATSLPDQSTNSSSPSVASSTPSSSSTTTVTTTTTTSTSKPQTERPGSEPPRRTEASGGQRARKSGGRSSLCDEYEPNCNFLVAAVPILEDWQSNSTKNDTGRRQVHEFIFVPPDHGAPLSFEESSFASTRKPTDGPKADSSSLKAEHRAEEEEPNGDDLELDYVSMDSMQESPISKRLTSMKADEQTVSTLGLSEAKDDRIRQSSTTSLTAAELRSTLAAVGRLAVTTPTVASSTTVLPTTTTTTTTTTSTTPRPITTSQASSTSTTGKAPTRVSQSTSFTVRVSSSTSSQSQTSTTANQQQTNQQVVESSSPSQQLPSSTTTPAPKLQTARSNQKLMRMTERPAMSSTTTPVAVTSVTSTRRSQPSGRRQTGESPFDVRRAKAAGGQLTSNHRQFFTEPRGDQRRRPSPVNSNFSPMANGADEEEAKILTRYSIPSQLSRLSSMAVGQQVTGQQQQATGQQQQQQQQAVRQLPEPVVRRLDSGRRSVELAGRQSRQQVVSAPTRSVSAGTSWNANKTVGSRLNVVTEEPARQRPVGKLEQSASNQQSKQVEPIASKPTSQPDSEDKTLAIMNERLASVLFELAPSAKLDVVDESASQSPVVVTSSPAPPPPTSQSKRELTRANQPADTEMLTLIASSPNSAPKSEQSKVQPTASVPVNLPSPVNQSTSAPMPAPKSQDADIRRRPTALKQQTPVESASRSPPKPQVELTTRTTSVVVVEKKPAVSEPDEYEGSVEDQLAKDAFHSPPQPVSSSTRKPNAYSSSRTTAQPRPAARSTQTPVVVDNGKYRPSANEDNGDASSSGNLLPGRPGIDYPVHSQIPRTSFDCRNFELSGFYADVESDCQAYHSCHKGRGGRHTFLCPNGTLFSQELLTCDWWYNVECSASKLYMTSDGTRQAEPSSASTLADS